jgi:hypothetical protein
MPPSDPGSYLNRNQGTAVRLKQGGRRARFSALILELGRPPTPGSLKAVQREPSRLAGGPCGAGDQLEGAQPLCVIVNIGHDHELVSGCFRNKRIDARTDRVR